MINLDNCVEEAYVLFSRYEIGNSLDVCKTCCVNDIEEEYLTRTPLREIDFKYLSLYIDSARRGSVREQREMSYFLPRILEMLTQDEFPDSATPNLFDRLFNFEDGTFGGTQNEYVFLSRFFLQYWKGYIHRYPMPVPVTDILLMIGKHFDVKPMLNHWMLSESKDSILHFKDLLFHFLFTFSKPTLDCSFSTDELDHVLLAWVSDNKVKTHFLKQMEKTYLESSDISESDLSELQSIYNSYANL